MDGDVGGEYQRGGLELANRCEWNKCLRVRTAAAQSEGCSHHRAPPEALVFRRPLPRSFTSRRTPPRPVASGSLRARLRAVVLVRNGRARLNEHESRLGCRTRACRSHEARADERRQTQGEENSDLIFARRSQKNPREPSRPRVQILPSPIKFLSHDGTVKYSMYALT